MSHWFALVESSLECIFVANEKAVCIGLKITKIVWFHWFATRSVPKWKWRLPKIQQQGASKRRKTSKGLYRKLYDYIKAYSPAYDLEARIHNTWPCMMTLIDRPEENNCNIYCLYSKSWEGWLSHLKNWYISRKTETGNQNSYISKYN